MDTQGVSLLSALSSRMSWLSDRQKVVAQNVANASTPGFKPSDLTPQDFAALVKGDESQKHLSLASAEGTNILDVPGATTSGSKQVASPDSETTMDGNSVVLEEEMVKMSDSRMQFEAAIGFYEKSLNMLRMAGKVPGK